jgi:hypothetical protein
VPSPELIGELPPIVRRPAEAELGPGGPREAAALELAPCRGAVRSGEAVDEEGLRLLEQRAQVRPCAGTASGLRGGSFTP